MKTEFNNIYVCSCAETNILLYTNELRLNRLITFYKNNDHIIQILTLGHYQG